MKDASNEYLTFGKTGQVGWELQRSLAPVGNLIAPMSIQKSFAVILVIRKALPKPFVSFVPM